MMNKVPLTISDPVPYFHCHNYSEEVVPHTFTNNISVLRHTPDMSSDETTRIADLKGAVSEFVTEREWDRFHRPKDVAMALSIEASELMELYLWDRTPDRKRLEEELGDILFFLVDMSIREDIDLVDAFQNKMELNRKKYPAHLVRGRDDKYTSYMGAPE